MSMSPLSLFECDMLLPFCDFFFHLLPLCLFQTRFLFAIRKHTVAFNACVRYVYRRRLFDHISDVSDSILSCSLLTYNHSTYTQKIIRPVLGLLLKRGKRSRSSSTIWRCFCFGSSWRSFFAMWCRIRDVVINSKFCKLYLAAGFQFG
jgi:hypothetical protein